MKLSRISLPLLENEFAGVGSGWGQAAETAVNNALEGDKKGHCSMLQKLVDAAGGCGAQTTDSEFIEKIQKNNLKSGNKTGKGEGQKKLDELKRLVERGGDLPMPMKPGGSDAYTTSEIAATYVKKATRGQRCADCIFFTEDDEGMEAPDKLSANSDWQTEKPTARVAPAPAGGAP